MKLSGWATYPKWFTNTGWLLAGRLLNQAIGFALTVVVARYLGEVGLGQFAWISAVVYVGNVATTFGLDTWLIREVAGTTTPNYHALIRTALVIQIALSILFWLGVNLFALFLLRQAPETSLALPIFTLSLIPLAFSTVCSAIWRGQEQFNRQVLLQLLTTLSQAGGAYWLLRHDGGLVTLVSWLLLVNCVAALGGYGWLIWQLPTVQQPFPPLSFPWRKITPLALLMVTAVLYQRLGLFAFSWWTTDQVTGWYSAGTRLIEMGKFLPQALLGAIFPILIRGNRAYPQKVKKWLGGIAVMETLFLVFCSGWLVLWLYEEDYAPTIPVVQLLAISLLPFVLSSNRSLELVSQHQEKIALLAQLGALAIAIPMLWLGIQQWGLLGGCVVLVMVEGIYALLLMWLGKLPANS